MIAGAMLIFSSASSVCRYGSYLYSRMNNSMCSTLGENWRQIQTCKLNMGCGASVEDGDESNGLSLGKSEKGELSPKAIANKFW